MQPRPWRTREVSVVVGEELVGCPELLQSELWNEMLHRPRYYSNGITFKPLMARTSTLSLTESSGLLHTQRKRCPPDYRYRELAVNLHTAS